MKNRIHIPQQKFTDFCRRNHIQRLSFFGSVLRDDFNPESDIDVLVEFIPGTRVGLIHLAGMEIELGKLFDRKVEIHTPTGLHPAFREDVLRVAEVQYEPAR